MRRSLYAAAITPASKLLKRLGFLSGPRFWLPLQMEHKVFRVPLMGGVGFELDAMGYSWKTYVLERLTRFRPGIFVDAGSHLGETLLDLRYAYPDAPYLGFEPLIDCVCYLEALIRMNAFSDVRVEACGLSDTAGLIPFLAQGETDADATFRRQLRPRAQVRTSCAPVFPFDEIRGDLGVDRVGFVKIDVEGYELEVLRGMAETLEEDRPLILCEVLFADEHADLAADQKRKRTLLETLVRPSYSVWQLQKTVDRRRIELANPVADFSVDRWTERNAELCDYLFLPREHETAALGALGVGE